MSIRNLDVLFKPRSIALIGASKARASMGAVLAHNLFNSGFTGPIMPVNPEHRAIEGVLTYTDAEALPEVPDLAVIATPPDTVPGLIADFAARESENARLLEEANVREAERARLSEQLLTAEQEERRRLALFLHDGPVQSMSGIALMLDAVRDAAPPEARSVMERVLTQHRDTIRALRDLSFNLEPVVLRDQGFRPAVQALTEQLGLEHKIAFHVDVGDAEVLDQKVQAALYQIIRESVQASVRRGPPTRMSITVTRRGDGGFDAELVDNAPSERRRAIFAALEERARTLNGLFNVRDGTDDGTTVSITLPPYAAK